MNIKAAAAQYDCREEIGKLLGGPNRSNKYLCPFHSEKSPSFQVYEDGYQCFGSCGAAGDIFDFWSFWYKKPLSEIFREHRVDPQEEIARKQEYLERRARRLQAELDELNASLEELRNGRLWEVYHEQAREKALEEWAKRGVPEWYVDYAYLGYEPSHTFEFESGFSYTSPTLVFPVFDSPLREVRSIKHRLLNPMDGNKYLPEKKGLPASLFYASPDLQKKGKMILTEGEIKAMVTFATAGEPDLQVVGSPSKNLRADMWDELQGFDPIYYVPDPDIQQDEIIETAERFKGHDFYVVRLPVKIDDLIIWTGYGKDWLQEMLSSARKVKV